MKNNQLPMTNDQSRRDASCTLCFKIVFVTRAGQLRRHKNQLGNVCHGKPFNVQPVGRSQVQLTLESATPEKGGAA